MKFRKLYYAQINAHAYDLTLKMSTGCNARKIIKSINFPKCKNPVISKGVKSF